jgi:hypothetical protein
VTLFLHSNSARHIENPVVLDLFTNTYGKWTNSFQEQTAASATAVRNAVRMRGDGKRLDANRHYQQSEPGRRPHRRCHPRHRDRALRPPVTDRGAVALLRRHDASRRPCASARFAVDIACGSIHFRGSAIPAGSCPKNNVFRRIANIVGHGPFVCMPHKRIYTPTFSIS